MQLHGIMRKIRARDGLVDQDQRIAVEWADITWALRKNRPRVDTENLRHVSLVVRELAKGKKAEAADRRALSWKNVVSSQLNNGAAATIDETRWGPM